MRKSLLALVFIVILAVTPLANGNLSNTPWIPPTNANSRITTSNGTVHEANYSANYNFKGTGGASITSSDNSKTIYFNAPAASINQGTYNQTLANNISIDIGGSRINFINSTNNPIHVVKDAVRHQVNVTIADTTGSGGITSLNGQSGPSVNI